MIYTECQPCAAKRAAKGAVSLYDANCPLCHGQSYIPLDLAGMREAIATALLTTHYDRKQVWEDHIDDHVDALTDAVIAALAADRSPAIMSE